MNCNTQKVSNYALGVTYARLLNSRVMNVPSENTDPADTTQVRLDGTVPSTRVSHCRKDETDVYIGRADGGDGHLLNTPIGERGWLGNPYPKDDHGRAECIELFREDFED